MKSSISKIEKNKTLIEQKDLTGILYLKVVRVSAKLQKKSIKIVIIQKSLKKYSKKSSISKTE